MRGERESRSWSTKPHWSLLDGGPLWLATLTIGAVLGMVIAVSALVPVLMGLAAGAAVGGGLGLAWSSLLRRRRRLRAKRGGTL